jgi:hypothetical protein
LYGKSAKDARDSDLTSQALVRIGFDWDAAMSRQIMTMSPNSASSDTADYALKACLANCVMNGGESHWILSCNVLSTSNLYAIAEGSAGNDLYGDGYWIMINPGRKIELSHFHR